MVISRVPRVLVAEPGHTYWDPDGALWVGLSDGSFVQTVNNTAVQGYLHEFRSYARDGGRSITERALIDYRNTDVRMEHQ